MKARAPRTSVATVAVAVASALALLWLLGSTLVPGRAAPATHGTMPVVGCRSTRP